MSPKHPNWPVKSPNLQILGVSPPTQTGLGFTVLEEVSGSGLILLIMICWLSYWCCKRTQKSVTRSPACVTIGDQENLDMMHTRVGAIGTNKGSVPGWETVRIQDPVGTQHTVLSNDMQFAFASALLDQLEDYGADVREHHRRLRDRHHTAKTPNWGKPLPWNSRCVNFGILFPPHTKIRTLQL